MPDDLAFRRALLANRADSTVRLVYADWLDEQGRGEQAGFLRLAVIVPNILVDGDAEDERQNLIRVLGLRAQLREKRALLDRTWLTAIGDEGAVGEVVVDARWRVPSWGVIVKEAPASVIVAELGRRKIPPRDGPYGPERPLLPTSDELAHLIAAPEGVRCRITADNFSNERAGRRFHIWDGKNAYYEPD